MAAVDGGEPLRLFVNGTAGSGKSYLINCLRKTMTERYSSQAIEVCAPTGTAAFNISGKTIHSAFSLPVPLPMSTDLKPLSAPSLLQLQERLGSVRLIIIDEMSMIGRCMLRCIDLRLREVNPHSNAAFGGLNIVLLGDFGQLPPVMDKVMFDKENKGSQLSKAGRETFLSFSKAVILTRVERVQGDSDEQTYFRDMLLRFRNGTVTQQDGEILATRLHARLSEDERLSFDAAPFLVVTKQDEMEFNLCKLQENPNPLFMFNAVHNPSSAGKATPEDAMGLQACVSLKINAKVMLRSNLWVAAGLTNGSIGTVHGFLFNPQETYANKSLPVAVCVNFDGYRGPAWHPDYPRVVPIPPITAKWMKGIHFQSRTQVPLSLAHATTIHKSQGWTLDKVKVDIGNKEICRGISFVAFSRARSLRGLMVYPLKSTGITFSRLDKVNSREIQRKRKEIDEYMARLAANTDSSSPSL